MKAADIEPSNNFLSKKAKTNSIQSSFNGSKNIKRSKTMNIWNLYHQVAVKILKKRSQTYNLRFRTIISPKYSNQPSFKQNQSRKQISPRKKLSSHKLKQRKI